MTLPQDYLQPEFFRFGWDQMFFVKQVCDHTKQRTPLTVIELGAGSGVISCELSQLLPVRTVHLVEYQQSEWEPYLTHNMQHFGRYSDVFYHWQKVSEFNVNGELKADLILCNPPYFLPHTGRKALDPRRNIAHRLVIDEWQAWIDAMVRSLTPTGEAWWLHRDPGPQGKPLFPQGMDWKHVTISGRMRVIRLAHL